MLYTFHECRLSKFISKMKIDFVSGMPNQSNMNMQGPPRGPPPQQQMGPGPNNMGNVQQMPAPHVNPAFFNQNSGKL